MQYGTKSTGQNSCPITATSTIDQTTREQLYIANQSNLRDAGYSVYPEMLHLDTERILDKLANRLHRFICDSGAEFLGLAAQYVRNLCKHLSRYYSLISDHSAIIYCAIQRSLSGEPEDCSTCVDDIVTEVSLLIFPMTHQLLAPGTAKLSSRVFALARRHCYFYHVAPRRRQRKAIDKRMKTGRGFNGVEALSELEIQEMKSIERAELAAA
jgi:hypothetical protein